MKNAPPSSLQALLVAPVGEPPKPETSRSMWPLILFGAMSAGLLYALFEARKEVARKKDLIEQLLAERIEQSEYSKGLGSFEDDVDEDDPAERLLLDTFF